MGRIIAIDYGLKRTGMAVTDPFRMIASPLDTVPTETLATFLASYCQKEEVDGFVVGMPVNLNGADTDATSHVRGFLKRLKAQFPDKKIIEADERFTSKMAAAAILQSGAKKKDRRQKGNIDKVSAAIILQSVLESGKF